jgi:hypothetical protein
MQGIEFPITLIKNPPHARHVYDVRFAPESGHLVAAQYRSLWANSGHSPASLDHLVGAGKS